MVTKNYNLFLKDNKENLTGCYKKFNKVYCNNTKYMEVIYTKIFDINDLAVILNERNKNELNLVAQNLTLIGTEKNIHQTIKEIKNKGFKLEEIAN